MGLWDSMKKNILLDNIEWLDNSGDTIVWKFPREDSEIKNGANLTVRESQAAVFLHEGELGDVFEPGRYDLTTKNIPVLTTLASWKYGFDSPFKADIFFVTTRQFTNFKWGTQNPIMLRDPEFGPVRLRAFGSYCFQVTDPGKFIRQIAGTDRQFGTSEITGQFRNILQARFPDALGEARVPMLDLAANYNELGEKLIEQMQPEFNDYGVTLTKFLIENISLPKEVEEALDKRSSMGLMGDMQTYTQYQTANAIENMADNPNMGGGMMGMIAGVGMGNIMGGAIGNAQQSNQQAAASGGAPPPIPQAVQWFAAINGQQAGPFDAAALQAQIQQGAVNRETLIWRQGMTNWTAAGQVSEIGQMFASVPPPMPPPMPPASE